MGQPTGVGIIGVGVISEQYFNSLKQLSNLKLIAVADLDENRARIVASQNNCEALSVEELLGDPRIGVVLNLTTPQSHAEIIKKAVNCGKDVYTEKPLALSISEIEETMSLARKSGKIIGCAPDTVLGTGIQSSKAILERKELGEIIGASAFWSAPGHELWHPSPAFYYQPGAGPLFDMGPYYLTTLVLLLGPITNVVGSASRSSRKRMIETGPKKGETIAVDVDTHISAILFHESGASSTITVSFEIWATTAPLIEIFCTEGTLSVPDPNKFSDIPKIKSRGEEAWREVEPIAGYLNAGRGYGLAELVAAKENDRKPRLSGELGFHILEIFEAILESARTRKVIKVESSISPVDTVKLSSQVE